MESVGGVGVGAGVGVGVGVGVVVVDGGLVLEGVFGVVPVVETAVSDEVMLPLTCEVPTADAVVLLVDVLAVLVLLLLLLSPPQAASVPVNAAKIAT